MLKCVLFVACAALFVGACTQCPTSSQASFYSTITESLTQDGAAIPDPDDQGTNMVYLPDDFALTSDDALELSFNVTLASGALLNISVTPDFVFQAMKDVPLTALTGTELTVEQSVTVMGDTVLERYDLPTPSQYDPVTESGSATFVFTVLSYGAPAVPARANFTTPSFLSLAFSSSATTALGTFAQQGTVSYALNKMTEEECPISSDDD